MMAIRLDFSLEQRLDAIARRTGRTKTYHANRAIAEYIAGLEEQLDCEEERILPAAIAQHA